MAVLHIIYILGIPQMLHLKSVHGFVHEHVCLCAAILPSKAVSADVLLCRLMADYDIKCL